MLYVFTLRPVYFRRVYGEASRHTHDTQGSNAGEIYCRHNSLF